MVLIEEVTEPEIKPVKVEEKKQAVEKKIENAQEWFKIAKFYFNKRYKLQIQLQIKTVEENCCTTKKSSKTKRKIRYRIR